MGLNDKEYTFKEVLEENWVTKNDDGDLHIKVKGSEKYSDIDYSTIALFSFCWGDYRPVTHSMTNVEAVKLYKMLLKSKDMYKLLEKIDTPEAKAIIEEINNGVEPKDGFREEE